MTRFFYVRPEQHEALQADFLRVQRDFETLEIAHQIALVSLGERVKERNAARVDVRVMKANWDACRKIIQWHIDQGHPLAPDPALIDRPVTEGIEG